MKVKSENVSMNKTVFEAHNVINYYNFTLLTYSAMSNFELWIPRLQKKLYLQTVIGELAYIFLTIFCTLLLSIDNILLLNNN